MIHRTYYSLAEAAERIGCKPNDLIHLAIREDLVLLVGVPDGIRFCTYDASSNQTEWPALLEPQLLALSPDQCQKIELNGRTLQSDFRVGYSRAPDGVLQRLLPSYGKPYLQHGWAFWRTYHGPAPVLIELSAERLFVTGDDVRRMALDKSQSEQKVQPKTRGVAGKAPQTLPIVAHSPVTGKAEVVSTPLPVQSESDEANASAEVASKPVFADAAKTIEGKPPLVILRMPEVQKRTGLSRSTIYDKLDSKSPRYDPSFPKQRSLGESSVGWVETEIETWLAAR